jgi:hypothetical protein
VNFKGLEITPGIKTPASANVKMSFKKIKNNKGQVYKCITLYLILPLSQMGLTDLSKG